ncbi:hypothetical protein [Herminiimonas contaminans]|uniref:Uncharacterized protein n=1 Tax=Herminiimonas contaminans TaxID=1111140 RepID=A0ABS0EXS0_9BURK|nr:hypothetical protein [Herminiimonas contaminans]MBF8179651.1 hypothetical protein [Herminiimonas contaminans]
MKYQLLQLFVDGIEIPRNEWKFQYTSTGVFKITDTLENGFNRVLKIAEFTTEVMEARYLLYDPQIVWWNENRFTVKGFERKTKDGVTTSFAQSWLITLVDETQPETPFNSRRR